MKKAWSHLPNAVHIDRILADVSINSESWHAAWYATWDESWHAAWNAAWNAARHAAKDAVKDAARHEACDAAWDAACDAAWNVANATDAAWGAARDAIVALISWDESSEYLNLPSERVRVLSLLGDKKAVLMFPAVMVFEQSKEVV